MENYGGERTMYAMRVVDAMQFLASSLNNVVTSLSVIS